MKNYDGKANNLYANLIYDMSFGKVHKLSVGTSFNADVYDEILSSGLLPASYGRNEYTSGAFTQYSIVYKNITAMSGIRIDHNSLIGTFVSPRFHFRYALKEYAHLRLSAGKGFRAPDVSCRKQFLLSK
ncbi:MAG: TonB-dependent receptor [Paludibacteraceae bacterium]